MSNPEKVLEMENVTLVLECEDAEQQSSLGWLPVATNQANPQPSTHNEGSCPMKVCMWLVGSTLSLRKRIRPRTTDSTGSKTKDPQPQGWSRVARTIHLG